MYKQHFKNRCRSFSNDVSSELKLFLVMHGSPETCGLIRDTQTDLSIEASSSAEGRI